MASSLPENDCAVSTESSEIQSPVDKQTDTFHEPGLVIISNEGTEAQLQLAKTSFRQSTPVKTIASTNENDQTPNGSSIKKVYYPVFINKITYDDRISLRKDFIKVKMPEIEYDMMLGFTNPNGRNLVYLLSGGCQCLLDELKEIRSYYSDPLVYTNYQVQLRPVSKDSVYHKLFLRLDPKEWYELEKKTDKDIIPKVNDYISRVQKECMQDGRGIHGELTNRMTTNSQQKPWCRRTVVCERENPCGFYACNQHTIYTEKGVWYAAARCSEYPVVTINPKKHYTNEQWVQTTEAWEIFCVVVNRLKNDVQSEKLPFECVYINFGAWQSQGTNGHAHMNTIITEEVINLCKSGPEHLRILQYSTKSPIDHRLKDTNALARTVNDEDSAGKEADIYSDSDDGPDDKIVDAIEKFLGI